MCGRKWREVERRVVTRSDKQCRERYCNVLDPALKRDAPWEPAEDETLLAAIAEHTQPNGKVRWGAAALDPGIGTTGVRDHSASLSRRVQGWPHLHLLLQAVEDDS